VPKVRGHTKRFAHWSGASAASHPGNMHGSLKAVLLLQEASHLCSSLTSWQTGALTGCNLHKLQDCTLTLAQQQPDCSKHSHHHREDMVKTALHMVLLV